MKIEYKRLTENELDIFIEMRVNQLVVKEARKYGCGTIQTQKCYCVWCRNDRFK